MVSKFETGLMYITVLLTMTVLTAASQKRKVVNGQIRYRFKKLYYLLSFIIGAGIIGFTNIGTDYENYTWIITYADSFISRSFVEIGFNGLCHILFQIFHNADQVIFILKTLTLFLFFFGFYIMRDRLRLFYAVFAYALVLFLRFYLLSMCLCAACMLISIAYLLRNWKNKSILWLILAASVHSSAFLTIPAYIVYFVLQRRNRRFSSIRLLFIIVGYLVALGLGAYAYTSVISHFEALNQYSRYSVTGNEGIGIWLLVRYIPLLFFCWQIHIDAESDTLADISLIAVITSLVFDVLSYKISILSRMSYLFLAIQTIIIPMYLYEIKTEPRLHTQKRISTKNLFICWWGYLLVVCGRMFFDVLNSPTARVEVYKFFNPF